MQLPTVFIPLHGPAIVSRKLLELNPILFKTLSVPPSVPATAPKINATAILVFQENPMSNEKRIMLMIISIKKFSKLLKINGIF